MNSWVRCIIFDLDGVIVETQSVHNAAFDEALKSSAPSFVHDAKFCTGMSSAQKLKTLSDYYGLPCILHESIMAKKRHLTIQMLGNAIEFDAEKFDLFTTLKRIPDIKVCIASNARRVFVDVILRKLKISDLIDVVVCGDDVKNPKPSAEIYMRCMLDVDRAPNETIIYEDSMVGMLAAQRTGAFVVKVGQIKSVNAQNVLSTIASANKTMRQFSEALTTTYGFNNVNVVVPMAGHGSRFKSAGFVDPKPFITTFCKPMVQQTIDSAGIPGTYIFCAQAEHVESYTDKFNSLLANNDKLIPVSGVTDGAARTVLLATEHINNDDPLFIINCDQFIEWDVHGFLGNAVNGNIDGGIITFETTGNQWSYARTADNSNVVVEVAEKRQISTHATAGIYFWRRGSDFVKYANRMIEKNVRVNNEFYVCPVYNEAIEDGKRVIAYQCNRMLGAGTPEALEETLRLVQHGS